MAHVTLAGPSTNGPGPTTRAVVTVDLGAGCRLAAVRIEQADDGVDLLIPVPPDAAPSATNWGSFPMAPWAGRIRHGIMTDPPATTTPLHLGRNHLDDDEGGAGVHPPLPPLPPHADRGDGPADASPAVTERAHAIHGTVFGRPWTIERHASATLTASCRLGDTRDPEALGWPFGGTARQTITVRPRAIDITLTVEADDVPFPAVIGWHPWFPKPVELRFDPRRMYEQDAIGLPTGRLVDPTPPPWDDCFLATGPVTLRYDRPIAPEVHVDADCDHWVVFTKPPHATCVEPQSGPPDAANMGLGADHPAGIADLVTPQTPLRRSMTLSW